MLPQKSSSPSLFSDITSIITVLINCFMALIKQMRKFFHPLLMIQNCLVNHCHTELTDFVLRVDVHPQLAKTLFITIGLFSKFLNLNSVLEFISFVILPKSVSLLSNYIFGLSLP